jgi:DNA-binding transcriptional MerR regulator
MVSIYLRTGDMAREFGVHPNTIRLYEEWGFLPPVPRSAQGYRLFTETHVDQMRLARLALCAPSSGPEIRESLRELVWLAAEGDLQLALIHARKHLDMIRNAREQTTTAIAFLENGTAGIADYLPVTLLTIQQAAKHIGISVPLLRRWEQYGLIQIPRHPHNRYRLYGEMELGWLYVIRMLRQAGHTIAACLRLLPKCKPPQTKKQHEDLLSAAHHWLSTLVAHETQSVSILVQLEMMLQNSAADTTG